MKYFTIEELCKTSTGIANIPTQQVKDNLTKLVDTILDPLREAWGKPIIITSGYRCPQVNKAVGGAKNSQHLTGCAADIRTTKDTLEENRKLFKLIQELNLPFDQLIDEHNLDWIHISFSDRNRREIKKL